jgi:predicted unusual protein kinase regulating ubiquinone biosynthesis (AarF/ABC1/UbiB family)
MLFLSCVFVLLDCDPHPGNVACDTVEGGRLIYYDFGMMDELKSEVKLGLVNLVFGIYENEVKVVCDALETMGILKKGVDRASVEKIVRFFLGEFATGIKPGEKWTSELTEEQQKEIKRQRRLKLGADLFSVGSDVPFKFPPTFTFVFRAFTSLDGIGKGLDPKYDLTRLAQPYLKELVDLRDGSATLSALKTISKKLGLRPIDIAQTIQQPRKVANLEDILTRMEQGDLKLRVRVLESERSFKRMELVQSNMATALAASTFLNAGIVLSTVANPAGQLSVAAKCTLALAGLFGIQVPIGILKLKALDKKFADFEK